MSNHTGAMAIPRLTVDKPSALIDEKISIAIAGLKRNKNVTLSLTLEEDGVSFVSYGHYTADALGKVDLSTDWCLGGTYTGMEPMGLFWSLKPAPNQKPGLRLMKKDVLTPYKMELNVLPGHVEVSDNQSAYRNTISGCVIERYYKAKEVKRFSVKDMDTSTKVRGSLFLPPGKGPFIGVIDMFGTAGGLNEYRAALLASRGFACLALPYFRYDDLPKHLNLDLEYFVDAVDWLYNRPQIDKNGIGVIGVCKGAELGVIMAILSPKVKAVVPINNCYFYHSATHFLGGVKQPTAIQDTSYVEDTELGYNAREYFWPKEVNEESLQKIEKAKQAQFLLIGCEDDQAVHPGHVKKLEERLTQHGMDNYQSVVYPGAGHLLEPPYTPLFRSTFHKIAGGLVDWGGHVKPHADAQEHSWKLIQKFLKQNLGPRVQNSSKL